MLPKSATYAKGDGIGASDHPLGPRCVQRRAPPACPLLQMRRQGRDAAAAGLGRRGHWRGAVSDPVTLQGYRGVYRVGSAARSMGT